MRRGFGSASGLLAGLGSLFGGSVVVGLVFAYTGPFLTIIGGIASIIYGTIFALRLMTPKALKKGLKSWG